MNQHKPVCLDQGTAPSYNGGARFRCVSMCGYNLSAQESPFLASQPHTHCLVYVNTQLQVVLLILDDYLCCVSGNSGSILYLSLIHISEPTRLGMISYAVFCL